MLDPDQQVLEREARIIERSYEERQRCTGRHTGVAGRASGGERQLE